MSTYPYEPINDRVLVKRIAPLPISSIIIAPECAEEKESICGTMIQFENPAHEGTVVAIGPGKWIEDNTRRRPMSVKPGDRVVFGRFADFGQDDLLVIQEDDILGIYQ